MTTIYHPPNRPPFPELLAKSSPSDPLPPPHPLLTPSKPHARTSLPPNFLPNNDTHPPRAFKLGVSSYASSHPQAKHLALPDPCSTPKTLNSPTLQLSSHYPLNPPPQVQTKHPDLPSPLVRSGEFMRYPLPSSEAKPFCPLPARSLALTLPTV